MDFLEGDTAEKVFPTLTPTEQEDIIGQIRDQIATFRSIPHQGYYGALGRKPYQDHALSARLWHPPNTSGPFDTYREFQDGLAAKSHLFNLSGAMKTEDFLDCLALLQKAFSEITKDSSGIVWAHCDLQPHNVMIHREGVNAADGSGIFRVTLIDWEDAGWYPEWFEWAAAPMLFGYDPDRWWVSAMPKMMQVYHPEFFAFHYFRQATE